MKFPQNCREQSGNIFLMILRTFGKSGKKIHDEFESGFPKKTKKKSKKTWKSRTLKKKFSKKISKNFFRQNALKSLKNAFLCSVYRRKILKNFFDFFFEKVRRFSEKKFFEIFHRLQNFCNFVFLEIAKMRKNHQKRENRRISSFLWRFHKKILKNKKVRPLFRKRWKKKKKKQKFLEILTFSARSKLRAFFGGFILMMARCPAMPQQRLPAFLAVI